MIRSFTTRLMTLPDKHTSVRYNSGNHVKVQSLRHLILHTSLHTLHVRFEFHDIVCGYFNLWRPYCLALGRNHTCKRMVEPYEMALVLARLRILHIF
jgi:hypothetical protein